MTQKIPLNDLARYTNLHRSRLTEISASVIKSGQFFNGPETNAFISSMMQYLNGRDFVPLANGTDALILALECLELQPGTRVAMMPNAGGYGSVAAIRCGLVPTYVDIQLSSAQMCPVALENTLSADRSVGAVIATHLYGNTGEIAEIKNICYKFRVPLIEDCAQSFGAAIDEQSVGTWGDLSTFSFYPTKNLGALGDAGGISMNNDQYSTRIRQLAQYGWKNRYEISINRGFNSRIDELQAGFLNHNFQYIEEWNAHRRNIVLRYSQALNDTRRMIGDNSSAFVAHLAILVSPSRDEDRKFLTNTGIETGIHYPILDFDQPAWNQSKSSFLCPNATFLNNSILTLPCFPTMSDQEIDYVCQVLSDLP